MAPYVEPTEAELAARERLHQMIGEAVNAAFAAAEIAPGVHLARPVGVTADGSEPPVVVVADQYGQRQLRNGTVVTAETRDPMSPEFRRLERTGVVCS